MNSATTSSLCLAGVYCDACLDGALSDVLFSVPSPFKESLKEYPLPDCTKERKPKPEKVDRISKPVFPLSLAVLSFDELAAKVEALPGGADIVAAQRNAISKATCSPCQQAQAANALRVFLTNSERCETRKEG